MNMNSAGSLVSECTQIARNAGIVLLMAGTSVWTTSASAQVVALTSLFGGGARNDSVAAREVAPNTAAPRRQLVSYSTSEAPGTVIIDTANTYLYFVLGGGTAIRYGIGVGREGFTWSGTKTIERKTAWPDWLPPREMLQRQPYLPRFMAGGPRNPLGARAMYLSGTMYRIHGTNNPSSIGKHESSGCIRMMNEDVIDLYERTHIGTKVVVLPMNRQAFVQERVTPGLFARTHAASLAQSVR